MKTGLIIIHYNDYESVKKLIDNVKDYKVLDKIIIYDNHSKEDIIKIVTVDVKYNLNGDEKSYSVSKLKIKEM